MTDTLATLIEERTELEGKIHKLKAFMGTKQYEGLCCREQHDLKEQLYHMENYSWVLLRRLKRKTKGKGN